MPRRKYRHSQRFDSQADRSHAEYLLSQPAQITTRTELLRLIRGGEDTYLELKVRLSNSEKITQGIVALANTNGGTIIFGEESVPEQKLAALRQHEPDRPVDARDHQIVEPKRVQLRGRLVPVDPIWERLGERERAQRKTRGLRLTQIGLCSALGDLKP